MEMWDCSSPGYSVRRCAFTFNFGPTHDVKKVIETDETAKIVASYALKNPDLILSLGVSKMTKTFPTISQNFEIIEEIIFNKAKNKFFVFSERSREYGVQLVEAGCSVGKFKVHSYRSVERDIDIVIFKDGEKFAYCLPDRYAQPGDLVA